MVMAHSSLFLVTDTGIVIEIYGWCTLSRIHGVSNGIGPSFIANGITMLLDSYSNLHNLPAFLPHTLQEVDSTH